MTIDDRSFMMYAVNVMDIPSSVSYFYPRLIPLHDLDTESSDIPLPLRCTADKLQEDGAYLLGEFRFGIESEVFPGSWSETSVLKIEVPQAAYSFRQ